jgi:polyisoprenoid-binding protein YceI
MLSRLPRLAAALAVISVLAPLSFGQTNSLRLDSTRSFARLSLVSSTDANPPYNFGNAEVLGWVTPAGKDPIKATFEFFIYPARQGSNLFDADGNLKFDSYADLARYSFLSFKSKHAAWDRDGKLELTGDLILTHVDRAPTMNFSVAYDGPSYSEPDTDRLARDVTFVVQTSRDALEQELEDRRLEVSATATIKRENFPGLWKALRDSIWPVVVLNRDCQPPESKVSLRDYRGFQCTGTVIPVTHRPERPRDFNVGYPGQLMTEPPAGDEVTIQVQLSVTSPH